ncbi:MAG: hypothetical protein R3E39_13275 [Anaerolineae bacterium]
MFERVSKSYRLLRLLPLYPPNEHENDDAAVMSEPTASLATLQQPRTYFPPAATTSAATIAELPACIVGGSFANSDIKKERSCAPYPILLVVSG